MKINHPPRYREIVRGASRRTIRARRRAGVRGLRGQAATEFMVIVAMALIVMVALMGIFLDGVGDFYRNVQYVVCIPFP